MEDPYKDEIVAKAASDSLKVLDMIMEIIKKDRKAIECPDYQSFLRMIHDPKYADIKKILDKTKSEIIKNELDRQDLSKEILKQRNDIKERE